MDLRKRIGAGAAKTAQRRTAKPSSSGNPQKRLRLYLRFKPGLTPKAERLSQIIRVAPKYDIPLSPSSHSQDAAHGRTARAAPASGGQGLEQDTQTRMAVEEYAMRQAELHYETWHARRRHTERNLGYDIEFSKGKQRLFVEVKGTRTAGKRVIVTPSEVAHAQKESDTSVLFVVSNIVVTKGKLGPVCSGGTVSIYEGWDPNARPKLLTIKDYHYELPNKGKPHYKIEPKSD